MSHSAGVACVSEARPIFGFVKERQSGTLRHLQAIGSLLQEYITSYTLAL